MAAGDGVDDGARDGGAGVGDETWDAAAKACGVSDAAGVGDVVCDAIGCGDGLTAVVPRRLPPGLEQPPTATMSASNPTAVGDRLTVRRRLALAARPL